MDRAKNFIVLERGRGSGAVGVDRERRPRRRLRHQRNIPKRDYGDTGPPTPTSHVTSRYMVLHGRVLTAVTPMTPMTRELPERAKQKNLFAGYPAVSASSASSLLIPDLSLEWKRAETIPESGTRGSPSFLTSVPGGILLTSRRPEPFVVGRLLSSLALLWSLV